VRFFFGGGLAVLIAIAAIGCGGGDSTEEALTKAQFIKRGDEICQAAQTKKEKAIQGLAEELSQEGKELEDLGQAELNHVYSTLALPPVKKASIELDELGSPAEDGRAEKLVRSLAAAVKALEENPGLAFKEVPYVKWDKRAYDYGFRVCSLF